MVRPSMPSLDRASASLFCSRGIQVNDTDPPARADAAAARSRASSASRRMSACLIFQRPDICSTTSLESIRTSTSAAGSIRGQRSSPAIRPEYSATLLDALPSGAAPSQRTATGGGVADEGAVAGDPGVAPGAAVGLDDERAAHRSEAGLGGADQDAAALLAAQHLVVGGRLDAVHLDVVELELAAAATTLAQGCRAEATRSGARIFS